jgi:SAM-dependent methyltransferase
MWPSRDELDRFYGSATGVVARRYIRRALRRLWPDVGGRNLLGLGHATPYLGLLKGEATRTIALAPGDLPAKPWPGAGPNLLAACEDGHLPLADLSFDRILVVHALEHSEALRPLLRDLWRVLADDGRMIVVCPHRRGLWARFERTPFGHGRPFSNRQLTRLLEDQSFEVLRTTGTLFAPPFRARFLLATTPAWDLIGRRLAPAFAGVAVAEAAKVGYAANLVGVGERKLAVATAEGSAARTAHSREDPGEFT